MPKHPRLTRRGTTFWHRAAIPVDIRSTYPKSEGTFSLRTKDPRDALIRIRKAAAEVDARFEAHRKLLRRAGEPPVAELSKAQLQFMEDRYYAHLLDEDDQLRLDGFFEPEDPAPAFPIPSFDDYVETSEAFGEDARFLLARGKMDPFMQAEVEEVLSWEGLGVQLAPDSPDWKLAAKAITKAIVRAQTDIASRNRGDVVETPDVEIPRVAAVTGAHLASVVRQEWIAEKSKTVWVPKTCHEHSVWSQHFLDLVGDKAIHTYTKADARAFKRALQGLPANWNKHKSLRGFRFTEAASRASALGLEAMSNKNINKIMNFVSSMWLWAERQYDEVTGSPFKALQIDIRQRARDERNPFTAEQLKSIFNAPIYNGCHSTRAWQKAGTLVPTDSGRFWVPLISLFSGARLGEIVQLRTSDVREEQGILQFAMVDEGEDQRLKNENSRRRIPVHPMLMELGFDKLLQRRVEQGSTRLFPDLAMGKDGYYSSPFSKHFSRFLGLVDAKTAKTSFHSFRHNFEDACREAGVPVDVMNALQGHGEDGMAARYGKGHVLRTLDEWLRKVSYPEIDLSHLQRALKA
ncbi:DUF6538 domain-containing protein [Mesorhizobium sp. ANAO-SY3R2]|uniref:DUF6538 domain-containing protein n=1 Tax=Mesorhizobium sp. ANAO-SY3R2 TaxID=3166644 RepID=UPI00366DA21B